ncbi:MAG TPA: tetratricopeptide repeat protein [Anaeromyxobacteraceae bacterium]|nr:tetratricopeptide repeat protein [Anaeromyxobacteraceae bacterium]
MTEPISPRSAPAAEAPGPPRRAPPAWAVAAALSLLVLAVFEPARRFGFVNLDDQQYVYENATVRRGLTWEGVVRAFTTTTAANWHPLTMLSHMADVSLFGLDAGWHHLVNVLLHAANAILLFLFLRAATTSTWRSAAAAALFAVHPLHVESVAWVSERKDVLSTLFLFASLRAYVAYARRPRPAAWAAVAGTFVLGLLSKPMVVTLPFLLLLLDRWPLRRSGWRRLVAEKLPLFALAALSSLVTWRAQVAGKAASALVQLRLGDRIENAIVSYAAYLRQTVWPSRLASMVPHPVFSDLEVPAWTVAGSAALLAALTWGALRERARRPFLAVGWLWYLGTLVPVIGLVQVGVQARADRYTYVPLVGVFVALAWLAAEVAGSRPAWRRAAAAAAASALLALSTAARRQVWTWRDSETLHRHALRHTERNWQAWNGLGGALSETERVEEAIRAYQESVRIRPEFPLPWNGIGAQYGRLGQHQLALGALEQAIRLDPAYADAWYNLGTALANLGRPSEAAPCLRRAVELAPEHARAWYNLGMVSLVLGDPSGAAESLERLRRIAPDEAADLAARMRPVGP